MAVSFREFPTSYRVSQIGIGTTLVILTFAGPVIRILPNLVGEILLSILGFIVLVSLLVSHYVIIRYPFISLVESDDPDPFTQHFPSRGSPLYWVLKIVGLITPIGIAAAMYTIGIRSPFQTLMFFYCLAIGMFMCFFTFFYDPVKHPTVSTFVRSTLGFGIILYPIFALSIFLGAWRCKKLLASVN